MGRGGQDAEDVAIAPEALLYGRRRTRLFRDKYIDSNNPGRRCRQKAGLILESYRRGDLKGFLTGLRKSTQDPDHVPDESTPLLLEIYQEVAASDIKREAASLGLEEPGQDELREMAEKLLPQLNWRIGMLQAAQSSERDSYFGEAVLRRGDIEDAAYLVDGTMSRHYCGHLAASDNPMILSERTRISILNGEALPSARAAFDEALRRLIVIEANTPEEATFPSDELERSDFSVYAEGDGNIHLRARDERTVCGVDISREAQIGSWRDIGFPGSTWSRCPACKNQADSELLGQAERERSDTSRRLEGHPALQGTPVDDFIDEIALSPEVTKVLRESVEPSAERSYEKLVAAVRAQLRGIEPLTT